MIDKQSDKTALDRYRYYHNYMSKTLHSDRFVSIQTDKQPHTAHISTYHLSYVIFNNPTYRLCPQLRIIQYIIFIKYIYFYLAPGAG